jgi:hypothetical protein
MEAEQEALKGGGAAKRRPDEEEEPGSSGSGMQPAGVASRTTAISEERRPRDRVDAGRWFGGWCLEFESRIRLDWVGGRERGRGKRIDEVEKARKEGSEFFFSRPRP